MKIIKKIAKKLLFLLPVGKYIVFESVPDLSDNTKPVFDKMLEMGLNKKYKLVWCVSDKTRDFPCEKNVKYVDKKTFWHRLQFMYYTVRAKCLISCNEFVTSKTSKQRSFYLTHGTAIKSTRSYYTLPPSVDYMLIASEGTKSVMAYEFKTEESKVYALGFPRNDVLTSYKTDLHKYFETDFRKIAVWYPTFRQHKNGRKTGSSNALPVLHDTESARALNEVARENGVLIVMKPHFAQDVSYINNYNFSNICFINDKFFVDNKISSYEFIASCDAMITDYSSVYYDYLLCDKPVALVWEDIDEYRKEPGFAVDVDEIGKAAEKIYDLEDFKSFVVRLSQGVDCFKDERAELMRWSNYSDDGKNAERVVNFIIEKAKL